MSRPSIAECYDKIIEDPSLLQLFPMEECMSIWELPLLGALQFRVISKRLFTCIAFPAIWRKAGVEFITHNDWKVSGEAIPMVILVTDGVGEGNLGMVTTFCCHNKAKMEASKAVSALHQCNLPEPSVDVERKYTNTSYIPWGPSHLLYLDVSTLSRGTSFAQFPLEQLHLHRLLPFLDIKVILSLRKGEWGLKVFPHSLEVLSLSSEVEQYLSNPISLSVPSLASHPHQEEGTQTVVRLDFHPSLKLLKDVNQARAQLENESTQETQELGHHYDDQ